MSYLKIAGVVVAGIAAAYGAVTAGSKARGYFKSKAKSKK